VPFCDRCFAFRINGDLWCEPCGNNALDEGKGNKGLAVVVLVAGLALATGFLSLELDYIHGWLVKTTFTVYLVPVIIAWRIAFPEPPGEAPEIIDRR
jgi:hypothetical protein